MFSSKTKDASQKRGVYISSYYCCFVGQGASYRSVVCHIYM